MLSVSGGITAASGGAVGGIRGYINYGYELRGSLWLDLHIGMVDGDDLALLVDNIFCQAVDPVCE